MYVNPFVVGFILGFITGMCFIILLAIITTKNRR